MHTLSAWLPPDAKQHDANYLVFVRDPFLIPKGVSAYIRLDPRRGRGMAKVGISDKKKILKSFQRQQILALLASIVTKYHYEWAEILKAAKNRRPY